MFSTLLFLCNLLLFLFLFEYDNLIFKLNLFFNSFSTLLHLFLFLLIIKLELTLDSEFLEDDLYCFEGKVIFEVVEYFFFPFDKYLSKFLNLSFTLILLFGGVFILFFFFKFEPSKLLFSLYFDELTVNDFVF